jgi:phosphatidylglycerol:prolipoprotein diacylglycerol transferase
MKPILFTIPLSLPYFGHTEIPVYGYGVMLVVAFVAAPALAWWRCKREGLDAEVIPDMALWVFLCGLVGARTFYCIEYWGRDVHNLWEAFQYWKGGIVYYGGIVGGVIGFFVYRWRHPFPVRPYLDALAPAIAVGTLFGRLGCFLNGCCYGDFCQLPWAVSFPAHSPAWDQEVRLGLIPAEATGSLAVHPTQIYSAIDALVLLVLLTAYYPLRRRNGEVMGLLMLTYPVTRFVIEYLRNDEGAFFAGLTISQNISVLLFLGGLVYWAWILSLPRDRTGNEASKAPFAGELGPAPNKDRRHHAPA